MYDNCGIYSIDESTGAIAQVSGSGPGDWPVISPNWEFSVGDHGRSNSLLQLRLSAFTTYQVDADTGALTPVPNCLSAIDRH